MAGDSEKWSYFLNNFQKQYIIYYLLFNYCKRSITTEWFDMRSLYSMVTRAITEIIKFAPIYKSGMGDTSGLKFINNGMAPPAE